MAFVKRHSGKALTVAALLAAGMALEVWTGIGHKVLGKLTARAA